MFRKKKRIDPSLHVHLDWKCDGSDVFGLLPSLYPSLKCLHSKNYQALFDSLAHEGGEESMGALAAYLEPHGLELWNINDGGDNYRLAIVGLADLDDFKTFWLTPAPATFDAFPDSGAESADDSLDDARDLEDFEGFVPELERIAPAPFSDTQEATSQTSSNHDEVSESSETGSGHTSTSQKRKTAIQKPKAGKAARIQLVEDQFWHRSYGGFGFRENTALYWLENRESAEPDLLDFSTWPPTPLVLGSSHSLGQPNENGYVVRPVLLGTLEHEQIWQICAPQENSPASSADQFVTVSSFSPLKINPWGDATKRYTTCYSSKPMAGNAIFVHRATTAESGKILRVTATSEDELYTYKTYEGEHQILAVNPNSCVIIVGEKKIRILEPGAPKKWIKLPGKLYGEAVLFDPETLLYFSEAIAANAESSMEERRLTLNLYNFRNASHRCVYLEDFATKSRVNVAYLRNEPKRFLARTSVEGNVEISRGHGDWWVLGHQTNMSGKTDPAWMWNSSTNEWLRFASEEFPRERPAIYYLASLDRYVATESCHVDLLVDFAQIYGSRKTFSLAWTE
jgi:hypothetical protein